MKRNICIVILVGLLAFVSFFRTGCGPDEAEAVNVMLSKTYNFTVIGGLQVTNVKPVEGATGIPTNAAIECDVDHELPIQSVTMVVEVNGNPVDGDLEFANGHVKWTPAVNYPALSAITWTITGNVENGQEE